MSIPYLTDSTYGKNDKNGTLAVLFVHHLYTAISTCGEGVGQNSCHHPPFKIVLLRIGAHHSIDQAEAEFAALHTALTRARL